MTLVRYKPARGLWGYPRWMDELDDDFGNLPSFSHNKGLNIHETDNSIVVEAVVAGVPKRNVDVEIENGILTIKAESKEEEKTKKEYKSSSYQYYYTTALSGGAWDKTEAKVDDGVVIVTIPKAESSKPRKISVNTK